MHVVDIQLDLNAMERTVTTLRGLVTEFGDKGGQGDETATTLGSQHLSNTLSNFHSDWTRHRTAITDSMTKLADTLEKAHTEYVGVDADSSHIGDSNSTTQAGK